MVDDAFNLCCNSAMKILLSFTGFHDPFSESVVEGQENAGPVLSACGYTSFDKAILFSTPKTLDRTKATAEAAESRFKGLAVDCINLKLSDPTDHAAILSGLRKAFQSIDKKHPGAEYYISISSGTPQMQSSWLLLAAGGEVPATILQPQPPGFVSDPANTIRVIDLDNPVFPEVKAGVRAGTASSVEHDRRTMLDELGIVGSDPSFNTAIERLINLAPYDVNVLLLGETGSGKEVFARLLHSTGARSDKPFISVNCAAYPETLLDSQLFGHVKGAFTGAVASQKGKFELAEGGVLFLDEIGELPVSSQSKLLRALEHGEIEPLGAGKPKKVDVRVVAATNRNIKEAIKQNIFREDLYFRFRGVVEIPPLRERRTDIAQLAQHSLDQWNKRHKNAKRLSASALRKLSQYPWPGNVRELIKVIEDAAIMTPGKTIRGPDLRFDAVPSADSIDLLPEPHEGFDLDGYQKMTRRQLIERALEITHANQAQAARLLGITPQAVNRFVRERAR